MAAKGETSELIQLAVSQSLQLRPLFTQLSQVFLPSKPDVSEANYTPQELYDLWFPHLTDATERLVKTKLGLINITFGGNRDGPALVLWPSLMMKGSMWSFQYEHFRHSHFVVLIDSPGIGKSEALRKYIDLEDCAQVVADILDALQIEKCVFGGNSWGAMLASMMPVYQPHRVIATVVTNGSASLPTMHETILMTILGTALGMCQTVPNWWVRIAREAFISDTSERNNPSFVAYCGAVSQEDPKSIAAAIQCILLGRKDNHSRLGTIQKVPALVIAGREDRQFSVPVCKKMADAIPTSKYVVIDNVGHLASRENPEVINKEIEVFLAEIGASG